MHFKLNYIIYVTEIHISCTILIHKHCDSGSYKPFAEIKTSEQFFTDDVDRVKKIIRKYMDDNSMKNDTFEINIHTLELI